MSRFNIPGVARGLTTYAIERQSMSAVMPTLPAQ